VHPGADAIPAKEHDAEEGCLEKEGGQDLVAQQGPQDVPDLVGKYRPVGAELKRHDHTRDHAHAEGDGEDLYPHAVDFRIHGVAGREPAPLEHGQPAGQPDREHGEDDVKRNRKRKLDACQQNRVKAFDHAMSSSIQRFAEAGRVRLSF